MSILPFGCRAYAVKPRSAYSKTRMESRAWVGINLGRSARSPGAYHIWVPSSNRIVITSDAYFDERLFPWRPAHSTTPARAEHVDADAAQPPGLPSVETEAPSPFTADPALSTPAHLRPSTTVKPALFARRVLLLFSGPFDRPDGIASFLHRYGLTADNVDNDSARGGGASHDLLTDSVYERLLQRCAD
eukprot:3943616-Pleurochrysis_carterae.AAC.1